MKAFTLDGFDAAPGLRDDLPAPTAAAGEMIVAVKATSVNPVDAMIAAGLLRRSAAYRFPVTLGRDFAGIVEQGAGEFEAGDEVFGFVAPTGPDVHRGAWAERIAVPGDVLAGRKPATRSMAQAGASARAAGRRTAGSCAAARRRGGGAALGGGGGGGAAPCGRRGARGAPPPGRAPR